MNREKIRHVHIDEDVFEQPNAAEGLRRLIEARMSVEVDVSETRDEFTVTDQTPPERWTAISTSKTCRANEGPWDSFEPQGVGVS